MQHYKKNTLNSLRVATLNKYLELKNLKKHIHLKKKEKILVIQHSISFEIMGAALKQTINDPEPNDTSEEIPVDESHNADAVVDDDEVLDIIGMVVENPEEDQDSADEDIDFLPGDDDDEDGEGDDVSHIFTTTRSGRVTANWRAAQFR